ncbi:MAG: hypothetical protein ETSY2_05630 [Candidatus Entotheonella gemina]|uniref:Multidrug transporter n=1 Tax=Candidatus Entotheonella gemina TaxID=1429439 RepID=W4MDJ0_9BACT|nr:MAG: hypothetical protein ETSY2_05630 [Candidatus Entotheonella gemina]
MRFINIAVVAALVLCMLVQAPLVFAEGQYDAKNTREAKRNVSGEDMVADLVFARPIGFLGLVFGTAAFVAALPFTVPTQQVNEAGKKLVVAPAKYTFVRRLGYK